MNVWLQEAKEFYAKLGEAHDFERDLGEYLRDGYVWSTPNGIIFGKPVRRDGGSPDQQWYDNPEECDAWFVKFASGDCGIKHFVNAMPFFLPFTGWMRVLKNKPITWWDTKKLFRRK
jgi:hypothetical protein